VSCEPDSASFANCLVFVNHRFGASPTARWSKWPKGEG